MIKAKAIKKSYNSLQVLKGIDLDIKEGEVVSIVGKSGAGKSTLLHILGLLDTFDSGELFLDDKLINSINTKELPKFRNANIGFVFQFHHLLPEFTALENVCLPAFIGKREEQKTKKRALELLQLLEVDHRKEHKPAELSGGEQQRVAVARALINSPKIVFADEPSGNLDSKTSEELHKLFFHLRAELNQTFVIVTHNKELAGMTDRKIEIEDGKIS